MKLVYKLLYLILKKDIIKRLRERHGSQFVDNVMETLGMPTNLTQEYLNSLDMEEREIYNKNLINIKRK